MTAVRAALIGAGVAFVAATLLLVAMAVVSLAGKPRPCPSWADPAVNGCVRDWSAT